MHALPVWTTCSLQLRLGQAGECFDAACGDREKQRGEREGGREIFLFREMFHSILGTFGIAHFEFVMPNTSPNDLKDRS